MAPVVSSNKQGFTLLEVMVSLVIMMAGSLGLLQAINVAMQYTMKSQLDYAGAMVADQQMALEMSKPFICVSSTKIVHTAVLPRQVNLVMKNYSVLKTGSPVSPNSTGVNIEVHWNYRGITYKHTIYSMASNYTQ